MPDIVFAILFIAFLFVPLFPAIITILILAELGNRFPGWLEAFVAGVVSALSGTAWTVLVIKYLNESSRNIHGITLSNYLFSYFGLISLASGLLMYSGAKLWKTSETGAFLLFVFGCGIFYIPVLYFYTIWMIQEIG